MIQIRKVKDGILIDVAVSPNSGRERIKGYDPWRQRLLVEMKEKPEKFRVNRELVKYFSSLFNVPQKNVRIVAGEKEKLKTLLILGVDENEARKILSKFV